jgi:anti-sigma-K factor RskA
LVNEHVLDLLPAYALSCLDDEDDLLVAEHLSECSLCRNELATYRALIDKLPFAVAESDPPPGLKDKILSRARQQKSPHPERQGWFNINPTWALLSLALVLLLGGSNVFLWGRLNRLESRTQSVLMTVLLQGEAVTPDATGLLVISVDGTHGTLVVDRLPTLDEAHQYQLWLIQDGQRADGGVFSVDDKGYKSMYINSPEPLVDYSGFGVTIEPAGGSPGPTGEKVLGGDL